MRGRDTAVEADRTSGATPTTEKAERSGRDESRDAVKRIGKPG